MPVSDYNDVFDAAGKEWNVNPTLLRAMATQESGGKPGAVSPKGAMGVMQIMPDTAKELGVSDPTDPVQSIYGGAKYMSQLLDRYKDPSKAIAAYNAGPGRMDDVLSGKAQLPAETAAYVPAVAAHYSKLSAPAAQPAQATAAGPGQAPDDSAESPADFLARTAKAAPQQEDASAFLARTGGKVSPAPSAEPSIDPITGFPLDGKGAPVPDAGTTLAGKDQGTLSPGSAEAPGRIGSEALEGAKVGFGTAPLGMSPETDQALVKAGVFNGPNEYNPLKGLNRAVIAPAAAAGDLILRGGNALVGAYQRGIAQAGTEIGQPQLGRDLAALPEAFPTGDVTGGSAVPHAPVAASENPLVVGPAVDRPYLSAQFQDAPVAPSAIKAIEEAKAVPTNALAERAPAMAAPGVEQPVSAASAAPQEVAPLPKSVGAAASRDMSSPEALAVPKTAAQKIRDLESSVNQSAEDRAGHQMVDTNQYVSGIPPRLLASSEFTPANALDEKAAIASDPNFRAEVEANARDRNAGMVDLLRNDAQDAIALDKAHEDRAEVSPSALGVFDNEKPVDATGLVDTIKGILSGPDGKRAAVQNTLNSVLKSLHDNDGNLETLPSQLYGARKNLTDMLKKGVKGTGDVADDVRASKSVLSGLLPDFDKTIGMGAPKFDTVYLPKYTELSQPINQMEFLQKYHSGPKKITDGNGYLIPSKVQKMLDDVLQGVKAPGVNGAKTLTDAQIQNIINVRNELGAGQLKDRMASVKGSDSFQLINRAITPTSSPGVAALKGAGAMGAHGLMAISPASGWGNALLGAYQGIVKPAVNAAKAQKAQEAIAARKSSLLKPSNPLLP